MAKRTQSQADASHDGGVVCDAVQGNWVDRWAPAPARPFLRLSRFDRPIGTWLLFLPCLWGLLLAILADGQLRPFDAWIVLGCGLGAILMRGAGCTWNDINDRKFDAQVARTRSRPLPSKQVTVSAAVLWMLVQAGLALAILLSFPPLSVVVGLASVGLVVIYPFAKRFTYFPQLFLGLAFNWGIWVTWSAHAGGITLAPVLLYGAGISWTLFYDTIYAHQDVDDDAMIGVKSTARLFGSTTPIWLGLFGGATVALMAFALVVAMGSGPMLALLLALVGPLVMGAHMARQIQAFDASDGPGLLTLFRSNRAAGLWPAAWFALAAVLVAWGSA